MRRSCHEERVERNGVEDASRLFVHAVFFATAFTSKTKTYLFLTVSYHINRKKQIKNCKYH
jgi:hypothetical protein